jgi:hypothetical protein
MNLSETMVDYLKETKNIYINIALVLGLIIVFVISLIYLYKIYYSY